MGVEVVPNHHIHGFRQLSHHRRSHFRNSVCPDTGLRGIRQVTQKKERILRVSQVQERTLFSVPDSTPTAHWDHP